MRRTCGLHCLPHGDHGMEISSWENPEEPDMDNLLTLSSLILDSPCYRWLRGRSGR